MISLDQRLQEIEIPLQNLKQNCDQLSTVACKTKLFEIESKYKALIPTINQDELAANFGYMFRMQFIMNGISTVNENLAKRSPEYQTNEKIKEMANIKL